MLKKIRSTLSSLGQNWKMTQKAYPALGLEVGGLFIGAALIVAIPVVLLVNTVTGVLISIPIGLLAATFWFSRRAMKAAYRQIEGQPGAPAAVIQSRRRG